jgi:ribonuclease P protein subunit POP4
MITPENIHSHEIVGLETEIIESSNQQVIGLNGTVVDETKSMFTINTKEGLKKIPKKLNKWKFFFNKTTAEIDGNLLVKRPEDRLRVKA